MSRMGLRSTALVVVLAMLSVSTVLATFDDTALKHAIDQSVQEAVASALA